MNQMLDDVLGTPVANEDAAHEAAVLEHRADSARRSRGFGGPAEHRDQTGRPAWRARG